LLRADAFLRQRGLREGVAKDIAHAAALGIHMATAALETHLRGKVGLGLGLHSRQQQRDANPANQILVEHHCAPALTSKDMRKSPPAAPSASPSSTWPAVSAIATGPWPRTASW